MSSMADRYYTATQLFALAQGKEIRLGKERCFYCAGFCSDQCVPAKDHVKQSFTAISSTGYGRFVCDGCLAAMEEKATIKMIDGSTRSNQKVRNYSWIIYKEKDQWTALAATKKHKKELVRFLANPPLRPFVICLSDSGQRHLLYQAYVCTSELFFYVTLEEERLRYMPQSFLDCLEMTKKICAVVGGNALTRKPDINELLSVGDVYGESFAEQWLMLQWGCVFLNAERLSMAGKPTGLVGCFNGAAFF